MEEIKSLPCKIMKYENESNDGFYKAKVFIAHEGVNRNKTNFSAENMKKAEETIKNRPLLAYIRYDNEGNAEDFAGHERVLKTVQSENGKEVYFYYLEQPIGIFPESCNPRYEEIDGVSHFVADCYIWEDYSNEAIELIFDADGEKQVSMEIIVNDYKKGEDDIVDITDYSYRAVTVLGDDVIQGMNGTAGLKLYTDTDNFISEFAEQITKKIQKFELDQKEGEKMEEKFGLGIDQVCELINNKLKDITFESRWGDTYRKYQVCDIDLTDKLCVLRDMESGKYIGAEITVSESDVDFSLENTEEMVRTWAKRENIDDTQLANFEKLEEEMANMESAKLEKYTKVKEELEAKQEDCNTYEAQVTELEDKVNALNEEVESLREFKSKADAEKERAELTEAMDQIDADFSFAEEEISGLKEKVLNKEMTTEDYHRELFVLEGMKSIETKRNTKKSEKEDKADGVSFSLSEEQLKADKIKEAKENAYGGLFAKYV